MLTCPTFDQKRTDRNPAVCFLCSSSRWHSHADDWPSTWSSDSLSKRMMRLHFTCKAPQLSKRKMRSGFSQNLDNFPHRAEPVRSCTFVAFAQLEIIALVVTARILTEIFLNSRISAKHCPALILYRTYLSSQYFFKKERLKEKLKASVHPA